MHYTKHIISEMDESMVQRCLICGVVISDYRNTVYPIDQGPPRGFPAGEVYISGGNPRISTICPPQNITINECGQQ